MTQRQELALLFNNHPNQWIPLPDILRLGIAQYNARVHELRRAGYHIENKVEVVGGRKHSWFRHVVGQKEFEFSR